MIYVDHLKPCLPNPRWPYHHSAHLFADSEQELHNFAAAIGLRREWFQRNVRLDHYDLTYGKLKQAIANGAVQVSDKEMIGRFKPAPKGTCVVCGRCPLSDSSIILSRANALGELPAVWHCQHCAS